MKSDDGTYFGFTLQQRRCGYYLPIMESKDSTNFGLTAGHVLPDGDRALVVKTDDGELVTNIEVGFNQIETDKIVNPDSDHCNTTS